MRTLCIAYWKCVVCFESQVRLLKSIRTEDHCLCSVEFLPASCFPAPARNVQKSLLTAFWGFFSHSYKKPFHILSINQLWKPPDCMAKFIGATVSFLELVFCFVFLSILTKCLTRLHFRGERCILTHGSGWRSSSGERGMWQLLAFSAARKKRRSPSVIFRSISLPR